MTRLVVLLAIPVLVSLTGVFADWMLQQGGKTDGLRAFQWVQAPAAPPACTGAACGAGALPLQISRQVAGTGVARVTARILWPTPLTIEASPGTHLEAIGAPSGSHPVVERPRIRPDELQADETQPVLLANAVQKDGTRRPVTVADEGFLSAWVQDGDSAGRVKFWARPEHPDRGADSREASIDRQRKWQALRLQTVFFQPVPAEVEMVVPRAALLEPVRVHQFMVLDWQADGAIQTQQGQLVPYRNAVGWVTQLREAGPDLRVTVRIPRTSPYTGGHWLWHRLDNLPSGAPTLPDQVQAVFFQPSAVPEDKPDWRQIERAFLNLPVGDVMRVPAAALDPRCAEAASPRQSCVWAVLQGVAVPVQVDVQAFPGEEVALVERAVFAGKALRAADWALLPREFRSAYGHPSASGPGPRPSRLLLGPETKVLLAPQPWLKAGLPVSVAPRAAGDRP